eukprot:1656483-Amphidinium_carterae.2
MNANRCKGLIKQLTSLTLKSVTYAQGHAQQNPTPHPLQLKMSIFSLLGTLVRQPAHKVFSKSTLPEEPNAKPGLFCAVAVAFRIKFNIIIRK